MVCSLSLVATVMRRFPFTFSLSFGQHRIERERGLAKNPVLIGWLGEPERLAAGAQDLGQRAGRIREVRAPGDARCAESVDDFAEIAVGRAFAPALRLPVDRRDLEIKLPVFGEPEKVGGCPIGWPVLERRTRQMI